MLSDANKLTAADALRRQASYSNTYSLLRRTGSFVTREQARCHSVVGLGRRLAPLEAMPDSFGRIRSRLIMTHVRKITPPEPQRRPGECSASISLSLPHVAARIARLAQGEITHKACFKFISAAQPHCAKHLLAAPAAQLQSDEFGYRRPPLTFAKCRCVPPSQHDHIREAKSRGG